MIFILSVCGCEISETKAFEMRGENNLGVGNRTWLNATLSFFLNCVSLLFKQAEGYDDGATVLYNRCSLTDFLKASNPVDFLSKASEVRARMGSMTQGSCWFIKMAAVLGVGIAWIGVEPQGRTEASDRFLCSPPCLDFHRQ